MAAELKNCLLLITFYLCCFSTFALYDPFDYFILAISWPPAACRFMNCVRPYPNDFIIHGLYPDNHTGPLLKDCYEVEYNPITDPDLLQGLNTWWPDLVNLPARYPHFWAYQWRKHGTCALMFYYQMAYFDLAVELRERYDLLAQLALKGIVPSYEARYEPERVFNAIKDLTGRDPGLFCTLWMQQRQLNEIRLCFDSESEIIDCKLDRPTSRGCFYPYIYFPPFAAT